MDGRNGQHSSKAVTLGVAPGPPRLVVAAVHLDDSLGAQTRDAALHEALHDHCIGERLHLGVGDLERSELCDAVYCRVGFDGRSFRYE
jgi:hypothetical protein